MQQPFSLLQYSYNYYNENKKKKRKPVGNFAVALTSGKLKKNNNIPSFSSFSVLTGLA